MRALLALFLLYSELFSDHELFTDRKLHDACTLAPPHVTNALCVASSTLSFLLYHKLFSDCELFTDHELRYTPTLAPPHMMHALRVASSARSFPIVP